MLETSDKMWSNGEGNGKSLQYSCLENPINSMKSSNCTLGHLLHLSTNENIYIHKTLYKSFHNSFIHNSRETGHLLTSHICTGAGYLAGLSRPDVNTSLHAYVSPQPVPLQRLKHSSQPQPLSWQTLRQVCRVIKSPMPYIV